MRTYNCKIKRIMYKIYIDRASNELSNTSISDIFFHCCFKIAAINSLIVE